MPTHHPDTGRSAPRPARLLATLAALACFVPGCSSEPAPTNLPTQALHPVKGSVQQADGKPLTEGLVTFVPIKADSRAASGKIQPDGTFALKTGEADGAPEGEFRVAITSDLIVPGSKPPKLAVPVEYTDEGTSGLAVTIKPGPNDLAPFKLVPVKKGARRPG